MYGYYTVREILKLAAKKGVKRSTFKPKKVVHTSFVLPKKFKKMKAVKFGWIKGQAKPWSKDYPGVLNIKRGLLKKGKPKLRIV